MSKTKGQSASQDPVEPYLHSGVQMRQGRFHTLQVYLQNCLRHFMKKYPSGTSLFSEALPEENRRIHRWLKRLGIGRPMQQKNPDRYFLWMGRIESSIYT